MISIFSVTLAQQSNQQASEKPLIVRLYCEELMPAFRQLPKYRHSAGALGRWIEDRSDVGDQINNSDQDRPFAVGENATVSIS
jgi:hypothetical protein